MAVRKKDSEEQEGGRRSVWITFLIVAMVAIGYAAVLVIGGNALEDAPFARQILHARDRLQDIVSFEPPSSIPRPPLESREIDLALSPSPIVTSPRPSLSPSFVPPPPDEPSVLTFTIDYENNTGVQLTGVVITNRLPSGTSYKAGSANPAASFDNNQLVWNVGTIPAGESGKVSFQIVTTRSGRITNVAVMSSNEAPDSTIESSAVVD